jgi:hypothetical protein
MGAVARWFLHSFGLDDGSGAWYLFWSGIVGDLAIFGAIFASFRVINCHVKGCWRLGLHPVHGTRFKTCAKHHPTSGHSVEQIHAAWTDPSQ